MLGIHPAILGSLGICFLLLVWTIWEEQVSRIVIRGIGGVAVLYLGNIFLPDYMVLKMNIVHIILAVLFGIPGVVVLFFINYLRMIGVF